MPRRRLVYLTGAAVAALAAAVAGMVALSPGAAAGTSIVTPTQLTTVEGRTGRGQPVGNLAKADLVGTTDDWDRYVEFERRYSGYLTLGAPAEQSPAALTGVEIRLNYRGPAPGTQTWTFSVFDWTANGWVRVGTNAGVTDWGPWTSLAFSAPGPYARYVSPTGALRLGIASNNRRDAADIDYAAIALTWRGGSSVPTEPAPPAEPTPSVTTSPSAPPAEPTRAPTTATSTQAPTQTSAGGGGAAACPGCWRPAVKASWNWVIATVPKPPFRDVDIYDVDGFDASAADVAALHNAGIRVICYISVGSYENWRPDAGQFPAGVLGRNLDGWPGERWLDIRDIRNPDSALARIMTARIDMCRDKGFDAVEFDNMDGYTNQTGFPLTAADQLAYNRFLSNTTHARGLSTVMKNDVDQVRELVDYFEMALNEECNRYHECGAYQDFIAAGKPVFNAEYGSSTNFCAADNAADINGVLLSLDLDDSVYRPCR